MYDETTVIYITDNVLDGRIFTACKHHLLKATEGKRLITVSQKPLDFGENICVGDIGRSGYSISRQLKVGLDAATTKFIAIAEHDCVYHKEHFEFTPPDEYYFYYNRNCWLLQYSNPKRPDLDGVFSFRYRRVQSQLIASRDRMLDSVERAIDILGDPEIREVWPGYSRLGEPGIYSVDALRKSFTRRRFRHKRKAAMEYASLYTAEVFQTAMPNIDIRHGDNLSGVKRGQKGRKRLKYWGTMEDVLNVE